MAAMSTSTAGDVLHRGRVGDEVGPAVDDVPVAVRAGSVGCRVHDDDVL